MGGHGRTRAIGALAAAAALLFGATAAAEEAAPPGAADVVVQALSLLGTPYRYGGTSPETGFDCSGLVWHVYSSALKKDLPRRSEDMGTVGRPVSRAELQPGDLLFFNTLRRSFSHVAIYIGAGRFVHAPTKNGRVRIEGLGDPYWAKRFDGARRLLDSGSAPASTLASVDLTGVPTAAVGGSASFLPPWEGRPPGP
jgi:cell wall-associated NlpC family hydrolase